MDGAEPQRVADFGLRQAQFTNMTVSKPNRLHAHGELAQEVGDSRVSRLASDAHHPLAKHGGVDQSVPPEDVTDPRALPDQFTDTLVRGEREGARSDGHQAVIHHAQVDAL